MSNRFIEDFIAFSVLWYTVKVENGLYLILRSNKAGRGVLSSN